MTGTKRLARSAGAEEGRGGAKWQAALLYSPPRSEQGSREHGEPGGLGPWWLG